MSVIDTTELRASVKAALNDKVRAIIAQNDISARMLSEFAGMNKTGVSQILMNKYVPNILTLCRLAKVLRCTIDDLVPPEVYR